MCPITMCRVSECVLRLVNTKNYEPNDGNGKWTQTEDEDERKESKNETRNERNNKNNKSDGNDT